MFAKRYRTHAAVVVRKMREARAIYRRERGLSKRTVGWQLGRGRETRIERPFWRAAR